MHFGWSKASHGEEVWMTDALMAYGRESLKKHGILDSGDAAKDGIGAMAAARWAAFYASVRDQGIYPAGLDATKAYTLQFVNQKAGMGK